jgi:hypothetical protein
MGLRLKKSRSTPQNKQNPQLQQQPQAFPPTRGEIEDWRWVFVDETWCNTQMSRYWRWAERGVRVPQN